MKKIKPIAAVLTALLMRAVCAQPAYANSAPTSWKGTDRTGAVVTDKNCPVVVDKELLTFDVREFPKHYYEDSDSFNAYTGKVTAEYTFRNPADYTVTARLVFPFGNLPSYGEYIYDRTTDKYVRASDTEKYGVTVDGNPIDVAVRHTMKTWNDAFHLEEELPRLVDGHITDSFFAPDLPVWVQQYSVEGIDKSYTAATAAFTVNTDMSKTRMLCKEHNGVDRLKSGVRVTCWVQSGAALTVYIFGELPEKRLEWMLYENGDCEKIIDGTVSLKHTEQMTFRDYVQSYYDESSGVLEHDWYNAQVDFLRSCSEIFGNGLIYIQGYELLLMRWYEYTLTIEPGKVLTNTVTAPLYPDQLSL